MKFPTKDERTPFYFKQKGQPLGKWEREHRLYIDKPANAEVCEIGNVYRIDSTCLEITDESQIRMQLIGQLLIICCIAIALFLLMAFVSFRGPWVDSAEIKARPGYWVGTAFLVVFTLAVAGFFMLIGYGPMRRNLFTLKRRPIRLNRHTRRIYAILTKDKDGLWEVPWSNTEFFCIGKRRIGGFRRVYDMFDIRHYTLDAEGNVVRAFVLGQFVFTVEQAQQQWEYYRRYMEEGPANLPDPFYFWTSHESFWEGFKTCRGPKVGGPAFSVLWWAITPFTLFEAVCRWLVLSTCSDPVWPPEIEAACKPEPNDPYARPYADDYIGVPNGPHAQPSQEDLERMWRLEPQRRREGALTRAEAEDLIRQQTATTA